MDGPAAKSSRRIPAIGFILSVFTPGLGQIYNGEFKRGIFLFLGVFILPYILGMIGMINTFRGFIISMILYLSLRAYVILDATIKSTKLKNYTLKRYNQLGVYVIVSICMLAAYFLAPTLSIFGLQSFRIPTSTMEPSFSINSLVYAKMEQQSDGDVLYGDVVIYKASSSDDYLISRVIGLPGDEVEMRQNALIINGKPLERIEVRDKVADPLILSEYFEVLPNNKKISIYNVKSFVSSDVELKKPYQNVPPTKLGDDQYYLISDHRDNSATDSRSVGAVAVDDMMGKVLYTYWDPEWIVIGQ